MASLFRNILVYLDGSESSITAGMYAIMLAKNGAAALTGMYVINSRKITQAASFSSGEKAHVDSVMKADADLQINDFISLARKKGVFPEGVKIESSSVSLTVKDYIKSHRIDLLVVGNFEDVRSRREELTSETSRLIRTAPCPVLVVRDDDPIWNQFE